MKKMSIMLAVLLLVVTGAFAQKQKDTEKKKDSDVPAAVKESFAKAYPDVKNPKWSKEDDNEYEAEFKSGAGEQTAIFDASGKQLGTESKIAESELPQSVRDAIKKDYAAYKVQRSEKATASDNSTYYEVRLKKEEKTVDVHFSPEGAVLKSEDGRVGKAKGQDKDDDDDDDDDDKVKEKNKSKDKAKDKDKEKDKDKSKEKKKTKS